MSFTTSANVKLFLNKSTLTTQEQAQVDMLILMVDGIIQNYCGWDMLSTAYTSKKFDGNGLAELDLGVYPIASVTSVVVYDADNVATDVTADVELKDEEGVIYLTSNSATLTSFTVGTRNVQVTFSGGYTTIPADLAMAATELVTRYFNRIVLENVGVTKERFEQDEAEYDKVDITPLIARVLDRYRKFIIA